MEIDFDKFFLTRSWATNDLKQELDDVRRELLAMKDSFDEKENQLLDVERELETMEAKTRFIVTVVRETAVLFTPPPPDEKEVAYEHAEELAFSKLNFLEGLTAGVGGAAYLAGKLGPGTLKLTTKLGRLAMGNKAAAASKIGNAGSSLKLAKAASAAKAGKLTTAAKFTKFGKGAMGLSAAIMVLDIGLKISSAGELNDYLKREKKSLEGMIKTAEGELRDYDQAIASGRSLQRELFDDAGVADISGYLRHLNEAIADLGEQKARFAMVRNIIVRGLDKSFAMSFIKNLDDAEFDDIALRVDAERLLAAGQSPDQISSTLGLAKAQVDEINKIVRVRNALVEGRSIAEAAAACEILEDVAENQAELLAETLDDVWPAVEGDGPLDDAARTLIVSKHALESLRRELRAKLMLDAGDGADRVAHALGVSLDEIKVWASALAAEKIDAEQKAATAPPKQALNIAVAHRLPGAVTAQMFKLAS